MKVDHTQAHIRRYISEMFLSCRLHNLMTDVDE